MVRRAQITTVVDRLTILERATAGETDAMIATALGCSIWTVRKWRRGQHLGRPGRTPTPGQPTKAPLSTISPALRATMLALRRAHPGWEPETILAELRPDRLWSEQPLPIRSRIAALFKHEQLALLAPS